MNSKDISPGERIIKEEILTKENISEFARMCGDMNPLHHSEEYAHGTRFGRIVACGPHTASLMMGLTASHYSKETAMLGLEFSFDFKKPVFAGETVKIEWEVKEVKYKESLEGDIVSLEGKMIRKKGEEAVTGKGKVLVLSKL